jgi:hypothetical protein
MLLNKAIVWNVFFGYAFESSDCMELDFVFSYAFE